MKGFGLLAFLPLVASSALYPRSTACNNSPDLCSKSYGEITYLGAHDSPFVRDSSTSDSTAANQYVDTPSQLDAGVRMVSGQVHKKGSEWHLCHSSCELLDAGKLSSWLSEIKTWLDKNKNDVVTLLLVNSDDASASDLDAEFKSADLVDYAYKPTGQSSPSSWPTLQELINKNTRLMTFVASVESSAQAPYLMDEWNYIFENNYDVTSPSNFSCTPDRPSKVKGNAQTAVQGNYLPLMNHFLYSSSFFDIQYPNSSYISTTNAPSGGEGNLGDAADECKQSYGRQPAFILVDFFNEGPAIDTVDKLNGVKNPVGRKKVSSDSSTGSQYSNVFEGLVKLVEKAKGGADPNMGEWIWAGGEWGGLLGGGITL